MKRPVGEPTLRRGGLAGRLLLAQTLVLLAGTLTAWTIAATVGPSVFHEHLARANVGVGSTPAQISHTEEAYQSANAISLSLALLAALVAALAVSVYMTRRIGRSVATIRLRQAVAAWARLKAHSPKCSV